MVIVDQVRFASKKYVEDQPQAPPPGDGDGGGEAAAAGGGGKQGGGKKRQYLTNTSVNRCDGC